MDGSNPCPTLLWTCKPVPYMSQYAVFLEQLPGTLCRSKLLFLHTERQSRSDKKPQAWERGLWEKKCDAVMEVNVLAVCTLSYHMRNYSRMWSFVLVFHCTFVSAPLSFVLLFDMGPSVWRDEFNQKLTNEQLHRIESFSFLPNRPSLVII